MAEPFKRKFIEGPFKDLAFRIIPGTDANTITLEFWNDVRITVSRTDYNGWKEKDCEAK